jgi:hypothetical protein
MLLGFLLGGYMKIKKWTTEDQMVSIGNKSWSIPRLFELSRSLPVFSIPIDHINVSQRYHELSLRDLVMHMKAVKKADLKYPIILGEDGELLDGRHRIMKAILKGHKSLLAVRFQENPYPDEVLSDEL